VSRFNVKAEENLAPVSVSCKSILESGSNENDKGSPRLAVTWQSMRKSWLQLVKGGKNRGSTTQGSLFVSSCRLMQGLGARGFYPVFRRSFVNHACISCTFVLLKKKGY
jgi:hypothetical protein